MARRIIQSVEPMVADLVNGWLKSYGLDYRLEQESLNSEIDKAYLNMLQKTVEKVETDLMLNCYFRTSTLTTGLS